MDLSRLSRLIPYVLVLTACGVLYWLSSHIAYTPRPGVIGPASWPLAAITLIAVASIAEIVTLLLGRGSDTVQALGEDLEQEAAAEAPSDEARPSKLLLAGGVVLVVAYAMLVPILGFILTTYGLLILFMYLGGERNHLTVWGSSTLGMLVVTVIFWKVAYVSVPRGDPPFDKVTQFVMTVLQVH